MSNWKIKIVILLAISLLVLSGCGNVAELEEVISSQEEAILDQNERIVELEQLVEEQDQVNYDQQDEISDLQEEITNQQYEIEDLMEIIEANQPNILGIYNISEWEEGRQNVLTYDLRENIRELTTEFLGYPNFIHVSNILFGLRGYVVVNVHQAYVVLSYELEISESYLSAPIDWETVDVEIHWEVIAYVLRSGLRLAEERTPRHLTDLETVTIRLYTNTTALPDGWEYEEEIIIGAQLWEETLRLLPEVWDLWYEGSTLYVDLMPIQRRVGSTYDLHQYYRLVYIFSSFPHVSEIRFLTGGYPGHIFNFPMGNQPFSVEEGRWLLMCELPVDDPWFREDLWNGDGECY